MAGPFHRAAIAEGVSFAAVQDTKFKHNRLSVSMLMPLEEGKLSERAIVPYILRQGTRKYPDFTRLNERLSDLYGAALEANVDKFGSYQLLNLGMVGIDSRFAFDGEDMVKELANLLADILLDPYLENGAFSGKETELEKEYLKDTIEAEINDKRSYALMRCRSIMCQGEALALRKLGTIEEVESKADHTIVFVHWGVERSEIPEDYQRTLAKGYIDAGADLVIGAHPHVLQGFEYYKGVPICYSLGNYLFGNRTGETLLLNAIFDENGQLAIELVPCERENYVLTKIQEPTKLFNYLTDISFDAAVSHGGILIE